MLRRLSELAELQRNHDVGLESELEMTADRVLELSVHHIRSADG